jgi:hypothetical protein
MAHTCSKTFLSFTQQSTNCTWNYPDSMKKYHSVWIDNWCYYTRVFFLLCLYGLIKLTPLAFLFVLYVNQTRVINKIFDNYITKLFQFYVIEEKKKYFTKFIFVMIYTNQSYNVLWTKWKIIFRKIKLLRAILIGLDALACVTIIHLTCGISNKTRRPTFQNWYH